MSVLARFALITIIFVSPFSKANYESDLVQQYLNSRGFLKLGNELFETSQLVKIYSLRNYQPIWASQKGVNARGEALKEHFLKKAQADGLNPNDYWTTSLNHQYTTINSRNWISFEFAATDALIKYVSHLCCGKMDPANIDDDLQIQKRNFNDYYLLNSIVNSNSDQLSHLLNQFAPTNLYYTNLKKLLNYLRKLQVSGEWQPISSPNVELTLGSTHPVLTEVKKRLKQLGYDVFDFSQEFNSEFQVSLNQFQKYNNLSQSSKLTSKSTFWRLLSATLPERLRQVEINLEKTRWLPKKLEDKYVFVNLAFAELKAIEHENTVLAMKTIVGRPIRRTPTLRDEIPVVELNPTWTTPYSIAIKDKLPKVMEDPNYFEKHNIRVLDANSKAEIDPLTIDWTQINASNISKYLFVQDPGFDNALGVVKFHLTNPHNIYLHDTNERNLFNDNYRLLSSGCVRLEQPLDFAAYLLRDQNYTKERLSELVSKGVEGESIIAKQKIHLTQPIRTYTMYLTTELAEGRIIRFADDNYGQDYRIYKSIYGKRNQNELF